MEVVLTFPPQFSHTEDPHEGYSQTFNFTYVPAYHNINPSNCPSHDGDDDETVSAANPVRMQQMRRLEAVVHAWMEGIPPEEELMDPNSDATDGLSDSEREWVRAVSPSIASGIYLPGSSIALGEAAASCYNRDGEEMTLNGGARGGDDLRLAEGLALALRGIGKTGNEREKAEAAGDKEQACAIQSAATSTQNTPPRRRRLARAGMDIPQTESLRRLVRESITPDFDIPTPTLHPPRSSSRRPYSFLKRDKSKRLSLWEKVTQHYSESTQI